MLFYYVFSVAVYNAVTELPTKNNVCEMIMYERKNKKESR